MQTEAEAFLQRIRAHPEDDAQRLIFADWLDEEGDPRGRFIRVQLALAELAEGDPARKDLILEERKLLAAHRAEWEAPFDKLATGCVYRRGFVDEANVAAERFIQDAKKIFDVAPLQHIHLLNIGDSLPIVMQNSFLSRLKALTVFASHLGEPLARAVAHSKHLAGLRRLALTRNRFGDDAVEQLARSPHLASLEELDLRENEIGETGGRVLAASTHFGRLRRLELRSNRLGPAGAEALAGSDRLTALHRLGLSDNDVGLPRLRTLGRASDLLRVPVLDLSANGLTVAGLQAILTRPPDGDPTAVRLDDLDLSHNDQLGDDAARVLAVCAHLAPLRALRLANCGISDDGLRALASAAHFNRVETLDLEGNPLGDAGFRVFHNTRHWRALHKLTPPRFGITPKTRTALDIKFNRPPRRG